MAFSTTQAKWLGENYDTIQLNVSLRRKVGTDSL